jgi:hypothetical protein
MYVRPLTLRGQVSQPYKTKGKNIIVYMALTSSAGCGRLVGIVRLRTKTTEFSLV